MKIMEEPIIFRVDGSRLPNSSPTRRLSAPADTPNTEYCCSNFVDIAHPILTPKSSTLCWDFPLQTIQLYKPPWLVPEISQPCLITGGPNPEVQGPKARTEDIGAATRWDLGLFQWKNWRFQPRCPENWYFKGWSLHESSICLPIFSISIHVYFGANVWTFEPPQMQKSEPFTIQPIFNKSPNSTNAQKHYSHSTHIQKHGRHCVPSFHVTSEFYVQTTQKTYKHI